MSEILIRPNSLCLTTPLPQTESLIKNPTSPLDGFKELLTCPICVSTFTKPIITTQCAHTFCYKCIVQFEHSKISEQGCPICRTDLEKNYRYRNLSMESVLDEYRKSCHLDAEEVEDIVDECDVFEESGKEILFEMHQSSPVRVEVGSGIEDEPIGEIRETNKLLRQILAIIMIISLVMLLKKLGDYEKIQKDSP